MEQSDRESLNPEVNDKTANMLTKMLTDKMPRNVEIRQQLCFENTHKNTHGSFEIIEASWRIQR